MAVSLTRQTTLNRHETINMASSDNIDNSPILRWIEAHLDYPHEDWCLIWPFGRRAGYGFLMVDGETWSAHRYICQRIHGPAPEGHVASHSCDRGHDACVNPRHIAWETYSENQLRRKDHKGGKRYKLTWQDAEAIKALKGLEQPTETAQRYGVSESAIRQVQSGKTWTAGRRGNRFTDEQVNSIRAMKGKAKAPKVAAEYGVRPQVIYNIWNGKSWTHVPIAEPAPLSIGEG